MVPAIRRVDVIVDIDLVLRNRRLLACVLFDLSSKYITEVYRVRKEYQYEEKKWVISFSLYATERYS